MSCVWRRTAHRYESTTPCERHPARRVRNFFRLTRANHSASQRPLDVSAYITDIRFGLDVPIEQSLRDFVMTLPVMTCLDAKAILTSFYETTYGIYNHAHPDRNRVM